jgi:hypothetical protein
MFKQHVSDRTDWRKMLKGNAEPLDLEAIRQELMTACHDEVAALQARFGEDAIRPLINEKIIDIQYPVDAFPKKVTSHNLDKTPTVEGILQGIKGQYLMFDTGVINIRKYTGYNLTMVVE